MRACHRILLTRHGCEAAPSHSADDFIGEHRTNERTFRWPTAALNSGPARTARSVLSVIQPPQENPINARAAFDYAYELLGVKSPSEFIELSR